MLHTRNVLTQILATSDVQYWAAWLTDMEEKQTELKTDNK